MYTAKKKIQVEIIMTKAFSIRFLSSTDLRVPIHSALMWSGMIRMNADCSADAYPNLRRNTGTGISIPSRNVPSDLRRTVRTVVPGLAAVAVAAVVFLPVRTLRTRGTVRIVLLLTCSA